MKVTVFGRTTSGLPILQYHWEQTGKPRALVLGGVHGDEPEGPISSKGLIDSILNQAIDGLDLVIVPEFNLDGVMANQRVNANGVDLNRNLPSNDWNPEAFNKRYPPGPHANSEVENQALCAFLEDYKPGLLLSMHSWKPLLNINGDCRREAEAIHEITGYSIEESIGYPTPGCLGTYAGLERNMPTITYEIERGSSTPDILKIHVPAIRAALEAFKNKETKAHV